VSREDLGRGGRRALNAALYAAVWLPYVAVYVVVFVAAGGEAWMSFRVGVANVLPEALLGLLVVRLPRRYPWPEGRRAAFLARQAFFAVAFAVACTGGKLTLLALDQARVEGRLIAPRADLRIVPWQLFVSLLVYLTLAGVVYALANAERVRREAERAARAEALRAQAELASLRAQLNPHFLMNTLHSVLGLVAREPAAAEAGLQRLGDLLHYALRVHRGRLDQVGLREEWEFVRSYLDLEKLRLGERLRVSLEADPDALAASVPPFCLQPLVENAVRHAVAPRAEGGRITVQARRVEQQIRLEVRDDGPGRVDSPQEGAGLGLRLVEERLAVLYRGQAGFRAESPAGGGFRVALSLPARGVPEEVE
jgi:signal transduction histidine kinase